MDLKSEILSQAEASPVVDTGVDEWREVIQTRFPDFLPAAEASVSVIAQLLLPDVHNPFALILLDEPSSGKTITINFFKGLKDTTEYCDDFTPASFVSHIAGRSQEQLEKIDLLPRVKGKMLMVPEMGTFLSESEDELRKRMGMMTRILDGEGYESNSGVYGKRGYSGDYLFMMLGASTPFPLRVWKCMSQFGHRLFFFNMNIANVSAETLISQIGNGANFKAKEKMCRVATEDFVKSLWRKYKGNLKWDVKKDDMEVLELIANIAIFLARFRGEIIVYQERDESGVSISHTKPQIEKPMRINQCFYNLARGHALACGRNFVNKDDMPLLFRVAFSSAPTPRPDTLRELIRHTGAITAREIMETISVSRNTAKKEMAKLETLGICRVEKEAGASYDDLGQAVSAVEAEYKGTQKWTAYLKKEFEWLVEGKWMDLYEEHKIL